MRKSNTDGAEQEKVVLHNLTIEEMSRGFAPENVQACEFWSSLFSYSSACSSSVFSKSGSSVSFSSLVSE